MENSMLEGKITPSFVRFALPLVITGILQQLYNIVDAVIVGNYVGELELAAIGATTFITVLFTNTIIGFTGGVTILVSQSYGAGKKDAIGHILHGFALLLLVVSVVLGGAGVLLCRPLLQLINTPGSLVAPAVGYMQIVLLGVPFVVLYNQYGAVLRGMGNSRAAFQALLLTSAVNIALDLLFVRVFLWGLRGAAIATAVAQVLSALYLMLYCRVNYAELARKQGVGMHWPLIKRGIRLGLPIALQSAVSSLGSLLLQNILNSFGALGITAVTTAYRIDSLTLLPVTSIGSAVSTFTGQNLGARNISRIQKGLRVGMTMGIAVAVVMTGFVILAGKTLLSLFGISEAAITMGNSFFVMLAVFYPVYAAGCVLSGYLQGHGDTRFTAVAIIGCLAIRVVASYTLAGIVGFPIIAFAEAAGWCFWAVTCGLRKRYLAQQMPTARSAATEP